MTQSSSLGYLMAEAARLLRSAIELELTDAGLGLTSSEARALAHVAELGGARQAEIADAMGVEPMTVCAYLDRLEKAGLVERTPDPRDRRAKNVRATAEAEAVLAAVRSRAGDLYDQLFSQFDATERARFLESLTLLRDTLRRRLDTPQAGCAKVDRA
ncbi:MarR family transcriptional regulator for hemolysin [Rhizobium sp. SG_E_25_P2]|uniref:MarR family winged helix-turn-helix transcriptional regulator n=1 Tax=Rhizobium sp. SG_E_25_P2 TaxID=2879942 RepID=UPI0024768860|nr:MarR family transcriptional regulator [Rhizobium sp. SG_E_25_P2]MDH6267601.1 MarR family transcriptional regulator for hemolysin [Rhizobium sp. SG_E_25_P2]